ncbi:MAG: PKD domain-containing protein [Verrucomicrobiales bacterium]|nr:PKD domain-containing protein [Verrucomicrobiales bacterium]
MNPNPLNQLLHDRCQTARRCRCQPWRSLGLLALGCVGAGATLRGAETDYYRDPPGCAWGTLIQTNISATSIAALPDGYVVSGTVRVLEASPGIGSWGFVAELGDDTGAVRREADFHTDSDPTSAEAIVPLFTPTGTPDGYVLVGGKQHFISDPTDPRKQWNLPWLWLVRLDTSLVRQWETMHGAMGHDLIGQAVVAEPGGYLVGAVDAWVPAASVGWLGRLDAAGALVGAPLTPIGCEGVFAVEPALDGGYVVATDCGLLKVDRSLAAEWTADPREGASQVWNRYHAVKQAPDGGFVAVGSRVRHTAGVPVYEGMVLTWVTGGGEIIWQRHDTNVIGNDLLVLADGRLLVAGTHLAGRNGGADAWLMQVGPDSATQWQKFLGQETDEAARSLVAAADGEGWALLGEAVLGGTRRMWVTRLRGGLQAPVPAFTFRPADPLFVDQAVTFDASASTAPGSAVVAWEWSFGDGVEASGTVVEHRYRDRGVYPVTLTVMNRDGLWVSTARDVVVTGLQMQWERYFGGDFVDTAVSIVEARDGGFMLCGSKFNRRANKGGIWALKTDRRGRLDWEKMIEDPTGRGAEEDGRCIIRAHDTGYVIAGDFQELYDPPFAWFNSAWLLKIDEAGELVWPGRVFGETYRDETAWCVAATPDGGYIVAGGQDAAGTDRTNGWLVKTDAEGNAQWSRILESDSRLGFRWVALASDGGYWATGGTGSDAASEPCWVYRIRSDGTPEWSLDTPGRASGGGSCWITESSSGGCVVLGTTRGDIARFEIDAAGHLLSTKTWAASPAVTRTDLPNGVTRTLDGGSLIVGWSSVPEPSGYYGSREVTLIKTGPDGETHWIEYLPGTYRVNEVGYAALALDDGSYVILARKLPETEPRSTTPVWLFRLAPNLPPTALMDRTPSGTVPGVPVQFSGERSVDHDGSITLHEWAFGDGAVATGGRVEHAFASVGTFPVTLTVVDDDGGENAVTNLMPVAGVVARTSGATVGFADVTADPASDPAHYPQEGAPAGIDWATACAFQLEATGGNGRYRFLIVFPAPFPVGAHLYKLPDWEEVAYTVVDPYSIEVELRLAGGGLDPAFVLARRLPVCLVTAFSLAGDGRLSLSFTTESGARYRVLRSAGLAPANWEAVPAARTPAGALEVGALTGAGVSATLYVERGMDQRAYFRIASGP